MRGKVNLNGNLLIGGGITPAYAGKSVRRRCRGRCRRDHPRMCGEKFTRFVLQKTPYGSPPRMRGKVCVVAHDVRFKGITPACAGKRFSTPSIPQTREDHPRTCGEKSAAICVELGFMGSPPRMRGKGLLAPFILADAGITPAHAGKSPLEQAAAENDGDHPRACGEKCALVWLARFRPGSPPHVRGKAAQRAAAFT